MSSPGEPGGSAEAMKKPSRPEEAAGGGGCSDQYPGTATLGGMEKRESRQGGLGSPNNVTEANMESF